MSDCPQELHYTKSHEWVRLENDDTVVVGITDHAQSQLGDLVFVELPATEKTVDQGEDLVVLESVKTAADVYAPIAGEVIEVNESLESSPELINQDAYGEGWLFRMNVEDLKSLDELMSAEEYESFLAEE